MKKIIITIALIAAAAFSANAQLRIEAGIGAGNYTYDSGTKVSTRMTPQVRALYEIVEFSPNAGLELGAGLACHKVHDKNLKSTMAVTTVDIPAHIFYNLDFGGVVITPMVGLYGAIAAKGTLKIGENKGDNKIDIFEDNNYVKRFDFGTDDEVLLTFRDHFTVGVGGQFGFLNLSQTKNVKMHSNTMYVTVGWKF